MRKHEIAGHDVMIYSSDIRRSFLGRLIFPYSFGIDVNNGKMVLKVEEAMRAWLKESAGPFRLMRWSNLPISSSSNAFILTVYFMREDDAAMFKLAWL